MQASACNFHLEGVIGYSPDSRGRVEGLHLSREEEGQLVYAGSVDHGFTKEDLDELHRRLSKLLERKAPIGKPPRKPKAISSFSRDASDARYGQRRTETENRLLIPEQAVGAAWREDKLEVLARYEFAGSGW